MGLGKLFHNRDTQYVATDLGTGVSETFTIIDNVAPDWSYAEYQGGMAIPGAWRAATLLSDLIGGVPWDAYRLRGDNPVERLSPTPPLLSQPNPPETRMSTFSSWALDLIWHGNAVGIIAARNAQGWPTAVYPVPAEYVGIHRVGMSDYQVALPIGSIYYQIGEGTYAAEDVIHIKGPCKPGFLRGMGVLEAHLGGTLKLAQELHRQAEGLGTNGVPTGVLKSTDPDLEQDDADALKLAWLKAQRTRTVAVLNETTDFLPLAWNPSETQLLEARKFTLTELALVFGLPLSFLGAETASKTYTNAEQEGLDLIKFSLGGHLARFEQTLSLHMPAGTYAKANLDSILRADTVTRYQAHQIALTAGFLTVDEVREMEDLPPMPDAGHDEAAEVLRVAESVLKMYRGVNLMMTPEEARGLLNRAGAGLPPGFTPDPSAPPPAPHAAEPRPLPPALPAGRTAPAPEGTTP